MRAIGRAASDQPATPDAAFDRTGLPRDLVVDVAGAAVMLGGRTVWAGVGVTVAAGEFVAVLGSNGVGKSTLLKAILGLVPLASGQIRVMGRPPGRGNHRFGYLPQRRSFDSSVHVRG